MLCHSENIVKFGENFRFSSATFGAIRETKFGKSFRTTFGKTFPNYIGTKSPNYIWKKVSEQHSEKNVCTNAGHFYINLQKIRKRTFMSGNEII